MPAGNRIPANSPACIEVCSEEVRIIGTRPDIVAQAREIGDHVYGGHENGGTNTLYVSPVSFETLNAAIEKGHGRPHLGPAADRVADANNLGAATAWGRFHKAVRSKGQSRPERAEPPIP